MLCRVAERVDRLLLREGSALPNPRAPDLHAEQEHSSSLTAQTTTMANANEQVVTFPAWIQGMIVRYETGQFVPKVFFEQVLDRTVSFSRFLGGISLT